MYYTHKQTHRLAFPHTEIYRNIHFAEIQSERERRGRQIERNIETAREGERKIHTPVCLNYGSIIRYVFNKSFADFFAKGMKISPIVSR